MKQQERTYVMVPPLSGTCTCGQRQWTVTSQGQCRPAEGFTVHPSGTGLGQPLICTLSKRNLKWRWSGQGHGVGARLRLSYIVRAQLDLTTTVCSLHQFSEWSRDVYHMSK